MLALPLAAEEDLFHHVRDFPFVELPGGGHLMMPEIFGFQLTKFMVLQVLAGLCTLFIFWGLSRKVKNGVVRGRFWNFWEAIALFIRDDVVRPTIGSDDHSSHDLLPQEDEIDATPGDSPHTSLHPTGPHSADRYLPFIWTCFFYILFCNLFGMIPGLGSPTGSLAVTGPLAFFAFAATFYYGTLAMDGIDGFFANLVPSIEGLGILEKPVKGLMFVIEAVGLLIKHCVLAVRLFANMFGGHMVIGVLLAFIAMTAGAGWYIHWPVSIASVGAQIGINLLELFVAFLQAYVFAFLATIFIATAIHHH